jgi:hypothetical protein
MKTLTDQPRDGHADIPDRSPEEMRRAAMIFLAGERSAAAMRANAADPAYTSHISAQSGEDEASVTKLLLSLADVMDELAAEGFDAAAFAAELSLHGGGR